MCVAVTLVRSGDASRRIKHVLTRAVYCRPEHHDIRDWARLEC
jgi:hypothetical protein